VRTPKKRDFLFVLLEASFPVVFGMSKEDKKGAHVKFDEATIAEHDKLRGTRQKIDEPKTPFHRGSLSEDEDEVTAGSSLLDGNNVSVVVGAKDASTSHSKGLDVSSLQEKLKKVEANHETATAAEKSLKDDFEEKRKHHYNEFQMLKKWREQHQNELDEEEDEQE